LRQILNQRFIIKHRQYFFVKRLQNQFFNLIKPNDAIKSFRLELNEFSFNCIQLFDHNDAQKLSLKAFLGNREIDEVCVNCDIRLEHRILILGGHVQLEIGVDFFRGSLKIYKSTFAICSQHGFVEQWIECFVDILASIFTQSFLAKFD
jgi:hypothetical protein